MRTETTSLLSEFGSHRTEISFRARSTRPCLCLAWGQHGAWSTAGTQQLPAGWVDGQVDRWMDTAGFCHSDAPCSRQTGLRTEMRNHIQITSKRTSQRYKHILDLRLLKIVFLFFVFFKEFFDYII